jgi:hypothetical protein
MTEAIFTRKQIEELAAKKTGVSLALANAELARLTKNLFVGHCPGDAGYGDGQQRQPNHLIGNRHNY